MSDDLTDNNDWSMVSNGGTGTLTFTLTRVNPKLKHKEKYIGTLTNIEGAPGRTDKIVNIHYLPGGPSDSFRGTISFVREIGNHNYLQVYMGTIVIQGGSPDYILKMIGMFMEIKDGKPIMTTYPWSADSQVIPG